jgi:arylsulfatase A-like enzyme
MKRREFLKLANTAGAAALFSGNSMTSEKASIRIRAGQLNDIKNILVLYVDQQRFDCLGCYGNETVKTPNLDRLARHGIRFTNAYTPAPVCTPARTSFQTGLWPHNHRLLFNTGESRDKGGRDDPTPDVRFFSEILKAKDWNCAHVGKWHIGGERHKPQYHGYDPSPVYYSGYGYPAEHPHYVDYLKHQGVSGFNLLWERRDPTGYRNYSGLQEGPQSASIPAYLAKQTIDVIRRYTKSPRPFFIGCNFWGPHAPYNIPRSHLEMYRGLDIKPWPNWDCDLSDKPGVITRYGEYWRTGWFNEADLGEMIGEYYGYITLIDEECGRILKALEDTGTLEETLIIFTADHGSAVGSYLSWDKGFGMYDCITRIPLIISHPSFKSGVSTAFVTLNDLAPTILEIAGCPVHEMDGASCLPILTGRSDSIRDNYIITEHHGHQQIFWQRMVRTPEFKYIFNPTSRDEFYDLEMDPWETKNIISSADKDKLSWAKKTLLAWMKETGDHPLYRWAYPILNDKPKANR